MACKVMGGIIRKGVGDLLTEEEIEALFDWHAFQCRKCRGPYNRIQRMKRNLPLPPQLAELKLLREWYKKRTALIRGAHFKLRSMNLA